MNGAHDMGGVHGFGAVLPEADEPAFHANWEWRVHALTLAMGASGEWTLDAFRFACENARRRSISPRPITRSGLLGSSNCWWSAGWWRRSGPGRWPVASASRSPWTRSSRIWSPRGDLQ
jgi:Nitrile hydratase beta subunit, N-terminal